MDWICIGRGLYCCSYCDSQLLFAGRPQSYVERTISSQDITQVHQCMMQYASQTARRKSRRVVSVSTVTAVSGVT